MQSKTFCFDKTVFRKNLTRFAPVWILYTICLLGGLGLNFVDYAADTGIGAEISRRVYFTVKFGHDASQIMVFANVIYALLVAQLLFGDLFNSRMCNALHALPLRRETWFVTNVVSGLCFSFVPTLVMALAAIPMLAGSVYAHAWALAPLWLIAANLQFLCFFGIAAFCAMCVGNRFTMAAGYGLVNAGAYIAYWIVDTVYTPLLYGVVTPRTLASRLTPMEQVGLYRLFDMGDYSSPPLNRLGADLSQVTLHYSFTGDWKRLLIWAAVGAVLLGLALVLYRKRHLEAAGDAVAFPVLVPVFQVLCALFVMVGILFLLTNFAGIRVEGVLLYVILALTLILGWIVGKMLVERSTQVFRLKNFYGLGALALALAVSLLCTRLDVLNISTRLPDPEKVCAVSVDTTHTGYSIFQDPEDIRALIELQRLALEDRPEGGDDLYVRGYDGSWVQVVDRNMELYDDTQEKPEYTYVVNVNLTYFTQPFTELSNREGCISRSYKVWVDSEAGDLLRQFASRWDGSVDKQSTYEDGTQRWQSQAALESFKYIEYRDFNYGKLENGSLYNTREDAESFLEAVKADCAAGTMAQDPYFHRGYFQGLEPETRMDGTTYFEQNSRLTVTIAGDQEWFDVYVWPDSENTVRWLRERGLLEAEIVEDIPSEWSGIYRDPVEREAIEVIG